MPCLPLHFLRTLNGKKKRVPRRQQQQQPLHPAFLFSPHHYAAMTISASLQASSSLGKYPSACLLPLTYGESSSSASLKLLDLPEDVLRIVMHRLTRPKRTTIVEGEESSVQLAAFLEALPVAFTCKRLYRAFHASLDNVCLWSTMLSDKSMESFAMRTGSALRRLVVRGCTQLTGDGVMALVRHARHLHVLDVSFVPNVHDDSIVAACSSLRHTLRKLLLRKCIKLTDTALRAVATVQTLDVLDISYCPQLTDGGMCAMLSGCGATLRLLSMSHCKQLSDATLSAIAAHSRSLEQICARGLPRITDEGFELLCHGIGWRIDGIDVLDCASLTRDPVLRALRTYCARIAPSVQRDSEKKNLREILVTTLRANIFIVHGCDPKSGRNTIHMVLLDNGDIHSANILGAGTTDLSLLGVVLCKSYGNRLSGKTKHMLMRNYGILPSMLAE